jgi:hypothetical protein
MILEVPIKREEEDIFERGNFSIHLAELLILKQNSPSFVLALEGKWGSGKTSIINLIKEFIRKETGNAVIVDFNPWLIGSLDSVIEGFLVQLASSINQTLNSEVATKAAANLLNFAKFLAPIKLIPGVEPWGTIVEKVLFTVGESAQAAVDMSNLDLNKRKMAVQKSIEDVNRPIIVFIDDIDRLPPDEIRIVIQVIKAIGDFTRVSYLLAFDPEPVIKSLEYNGTYNGAGYLEKIVQAAYPIPRISYWHLKVFIRNHLNDLLANMQVTMSEVDNQLFSEVLDTTAVVRSLSTPRDVIRLINRLKITIKNILGEVNFADILAFETLELKYPKISNAIRNNPEIFLKTSLLEGDYILQDHLDDMTDDSETEEEPRFVKDLLASCNPSEVKNIRSILSYIFPALLGRWESISQEESIINNRICTSESLLKLLYSGPNKYIFSSKEVKHFFESKSDRREILLDYLQSGSIVNWLQYANQFVKSIEINDSLSLCSELLEISEIAFKDYQQNLADAISNLLLTLIYQSNFRKPILAFISSTEKSLCVSENVIRSLLLKYNLWNSGIFKGSRVFTHKELKELPFPLDDLIHQKNVWLDTVRKVTSETNIFENEAEPVSILFRWGQLNDNDFSEVQNYIEQITNNDEIFISFLECFQGKGIIGIEKLIKHLPTFISRIESLNNPSSCINEMMTYLKKINLKDEQPSEI